MQAMIADRFIYVVGEEQTAILPESEEVIAFTASNMHRIDTGELALVLANVFGRGRMFPGPTEALTPLIHEFIRRSEPYGQIGGSLRHARCTLVTAFRKLDGDIAVQVAAVMPVLPGSLHPDRPEQFHALLIDSLPDFQEAFTTEAYAPDSKLVSIIKETTLHHINRTLH